MIDKSKRRAVIKRHGSIVTVHYTGGYDCTWLDMYLDEERCNMTVVSDIGPYSYHWFGGIGKDESFARFCCRWFRDGEWLLRKCIGEQHVPLKFDRVTSEKNLIHEVVNSYDEDDAEGMKDAVYYLKSCLSESSYDNADAWVASVSARAEHYDIDLPEEWTACVEEGYSPWQRRFAEICDEVIRPALLDFLNKEE